MTESGVTKQSQSQTRLDPEHVFTFTCSPGVPCFTQCCQDVTIVLTPYDVVRMKNALGIPSDEFLENYTLVIPKQNRLIPLVVLKMREDNKRCPFVGEEGCALYADRPWPCRMFPLDMNDDGTFGIIHKASLCQGLGAGEAGRISDWLVGQGVPIYDEMNRLFSQVTSPLGAQEWDIDNPRVHQMIFMALYNLDRFRAFIFQSSFLDRFDIDHVTIEKLKRSDVELLKFAFDWIKFGILGQKTLRVKPDAAGVPEKEG
jgi:hypothetical protein